MKHKSRRGLWLSVAALALTLTFFAAASSFAGPVSRVCRGAGLPSDAPLFYLISKKMRQKQASSIPDLRAGAESHPSRRVSVDTKLQSIGI